MRQDADPTRRKLLFGLAGGALYAASSRFEKPLAVVAGIEKPKPKPPSKPVEIFPSPSPSPAELLNVSIPSFTFEGQIEGMVDKRGDQYASCVPTPGFKELHPQCASWERVLLLFPDFTPDLKKQIDENKRNILRIPIPITTLEEMSNTPTILRNRATPQEVVRLIAANNTFQIINGGDLYLTVLSKSQMDIY